MSDMKTKINLGPIASEVLKRINESEEIETLWYMTNVTAQKRLKMTDHGFKHFEIVLNNALSMLSILKESSVETAMEKDHELSFDHAQAVVVMASVFHDLGMSIHRDNHEEFSLFIVNQFIDKLLDFLPVKERVIVKSDTLHAIISHRKDGRPLTVEAGVVRVADALDMTEGRSRFSESKMSDWSIHSVSAQAIDEVEIVKGSEKPVKILVSMNHTAGVFQTDELFKKKVEGSGIDKFIEIEIFLVKDGVKELFRRFVK